MTKVRQLDINPVELKSCMHLRAIRVARLAESLGGLLAVRRALAAVLREGEEPMLEADRRELTAIAPQDSAVHDTPSAPSPN